MGERLTLKLAVVNSADPLEFSPLLLYSKLSYNRDAIGGSHYNDYNIIYIDAVILSLYKIDRLFCSSPLAYAIEDIMHRFLVILLQILLAKVLLAEGLVVEDNKKPIVYTGTATINRDGIKTKFITRLHLLKIGVNPTGAPDYYATVVYYLGDDASNEYSTHSYGYTTVNPETQEMLLISNANPKFPVISLRFNDDASLAEGVINISSENVGSLALKSGWTYDSAGVETKFGGVYQSKCKSAYSSLVSQTRWITIAPNRTSPFGLNDIEKDFLKHFNHFYNSEELRTCDKCGTTMETDKRFVTK